MIKISDNFNFLNRSFLPKLSNNELSELIQQFQQGSKATEEKIIEHNFRLVKSRITKRFYNTEYDAEDLFQIGCIGLANAVKTFNPSKGSAFSSYAVTCIDNEILMFIRKNKKAIKTDSIDKEIYTGKNGTAVFLKDILPSDDDLDEALANSEIHKMIRELVNRLPDKEKQIIELRFGFHDDKLYSQSEVAKILGVSQSCVAKKQKKILQKLKEQLKAAYSRDLLKGTMSENKNKSDKKGKKLQSIYEYFKNYNKKQIDFIISMLSEKDRNLLIMRYGGNLDKPIHVKLPKKLYNYFYGSLLRKMKIMLSKLFTTEKQSLETQSGSEKDTCFLDLLRDPTFMEIMSIFSLKEAIIFLLELGYIDGKSFSTESIADFFGIETSKVREVIKQGLMIYKGNIDRILDEVTIPTATRNNARVKVLPTDEK